MARTAASTWPGADRSVGAIKGSPPISLASVVSLPPDLATSASFAPSAEKRRAAARPMPELAPVMTMTLSRTDCATSVSPDFRLQ